MRLNELFLNEEALETKDAEDIWDDAESQEYRPATMYQVKSSGTPPKYTVFSVQGTTRKPYGVMTAQELKASLEPLRPNQNPDAEGYTTYVSVDRVQAFKYKGDPVKVMLGKVGTRISSGDYLVRTNDGNNFQYEVQSASTFEGTMQKV